jgi:hypothetical protein
VDFFDIVILAIISFSLLAGVGFIFLTRSLQRQFEESQYWPSVEGVVTASTTREATKMKYRSALRGYAPLVKYDYAVDGVSYQGERLSWAEPFFLYEPDAAKFSADYPPGITVTVYYDPNKPERSVVDPFSGKPDDLGGYGIGCLVGAALVAFLYVPTMSWGFLAAELPLFTGPAPTSWPLRPATELLLSVDAFPPGWKLAPPVSPDLDELLGDRLATAVFQPAEGEGGVVQFISREESQGEAAATYRDWLKTRLEAISEVSTPTYDEPRADAHAARCGISAGNYLCLVLLRYGNYVIDLRFAGGGQREIEPTLQALDRLVMERFELGR